MFLKQSKGNTPVEHKPHVPEYLLAEHGRNTDGTRAYSKRKQLSKQQDYRLLLACWARASVEHHPHVPVYLIAEHGRNTDGTQTYSTRKQLSTQQDYRLHLAFWTPTCTALLVSGTRTHPARNTGGFYGPNSCEGIPVVN